MFDKRVLFQDSDVHTRGGASHHRKNRMRQVKRSKSMIQDMKTTLTPGQRESHITRMKDRIKAAQAKIRNSKQKKPEAIQSQTSVGVMKVGVA